MAHDSPRAHRPVIPHACPQMLASSSGRSASSSRWDQEGDVVQVYAPPTEECTEVVLWSPYDNVGTARHQCIKDTWNLVQGKRSQMFTGATAADIENGKKQLKDMYVSQDERKLEDTSERQKILSNLLNVLHKSLEDGNVDSRDAHERMMARESLGGDESDSSMHTGTDDSRTRKDTCMAKRKWETRSCGYKEKRIERARKHKEQGLNPLEERRKAAIEKESLRNAGTISLINKETGVTYNVCDASPDTSLAGKAAEAHLTMQILLHEGRVRHATRRETERQRNSPGTK